MIEVAYDPITLCGIGLNPAVDIHSGPLPQDHFLPRCIMYVATNRKNGHTYVGMTEKGLAARKASHLWRATKEPRGKFHRAIAKHGSDSFFWHVVEVWPDYFSALEAERKIIRILRPEYNMTEGGGGIKGYVHTPESKAKMVAAKLGKPSIWTKQRMPDYIRQKLAECRHNEKGRPQSDAARTATLLNAKKGNEARRRKVLNMETGKIYASVTAASAETSITKTTLCRMCKAGHLFKYWSGVS